MTIRHAVDGAQAHAAVRQMGDTLTATTPENLLAYWATHPDERVPIALAQALGARGGGVRAKARAALLRRASADALREGVRFTPLLDALCEGDGELPWLDDGTTAVGVEEELVRYVSDPATSGGDLRDLLRFRTQAVHRLVFRWGAALDASVVRDQAAEDPEPLLAIAAHPNLPASAAAAVRARCERMICGGTKDQLQDVLPLVGALARATDAAPFADDSPAWTAVRDAVLSAPSLAAPVFRACRPASQAFMRETVGALTGAASGGTSTLTDDAAEAALVHPTGDAAYDAALIAQLLPQADHRLWNCLQAPVLRPQMLVALVEVPMVRGHTGFVASIARHVSATSDVWLAMLQRPGMVGAATCIASHPMAIADASVRAALRNSKNRQVLAAVCRASTADDLARSLDALVRVSPADALHYLETVPLPTGAQIPAAIATTLLGHAESGLRERTLRVIHQLAVGGELPLHGRARGRTR
jgi:hypothetical protein